MAIKEENAGVSVDRFNDNNNVYWNMSGGLDIIPINDFYVKGVRVYIDGASKDFWIQNIWVAEVYPKTLTNITYNTETIKVIKNYNVGISPNGGQKISNIWTPYYYFDNPVRVYAGHRYVIGLYWTSGGSYSSDGAVRKNQKVSKDYNYNTSLISQCIMRFTGGSGLIYNPAIVKNLNTADITNGYLFAWMDFIADTFDYSYLVRDRKETKKIFVPTIDTDLTLSQDNLGDWNLNKLQSNTTTSVSFPIFKDVKYNLTIPEGAKFCYAGTLDKKVSDFEDSETRVLNRILVDDATVTNPLELEFTALQNERSFVAYINDADAGLTPDQVTLTGTAGYELYKLTNEEGTEYEALPDFDITSEQFKNGSPLFVEPQANVLMDFAHPSVLYWQELETDNPMLQVKITATPHSQHVTGDKISLEVDGVLCDIAEMQVDSEGGAILAFSFDDKQTWVYWKPENENDVNVGEWVTITEADRFNGQSKDVTDALSPANWKLAIGDADGFYIRASFISTSQALAKIGVKYSARDTATTTEVETEGTD